jgi:two-component system sensor histidine kinase YesM
MKTRMSLKNKVAITLMVMLISFTLILITIIRITSSTAIQNFIYKDIYARQSEIEEGILMVLDEVNLLYSRMVLNGDFLQVLLNNELSENEKQVLYKDVMQRVGVNTELFGDVVVYYDELIYSFKRDNSIELPDPNFLKSIIGTEQLLKQGKIVSDLAGKRYLLIGKRMVNFPVGSVTGAVVFYVSEEVLSDFSTGISKELGYSFITSDDSYVITHNNKKYIGATIFDADMFKSDNLPGYEIRTLNGEKSIIIVNELEKINNRYGFNWKIVSVISYNTLFKDIFELNKYTLILGFIMALLAAAISFRISTGITQPINNIIQKLRNFARSGKKQVVRNKPGVLKDELWELEHTYDEMVNRIMRLIEKNKQEMENQRKLELEALQMQINPHFLYNTLDTIAWMAKIKKQKEIEQLVLALAKFFRISLHKGEKYILVSEEIELIKNFIKIELIRFPDKFTIEYNVADDVKNEETLKLILQPIVENAIKHGVSELDETGHITINVFGDKKYIYFEVIDDGIGFEPFDDLFSNNHLLSSREGGYGLKNVDERIKLEYGRDCGISVSSKPNLGSRVRLKIKRRYKKKNEE